MKKYSLDQIKLEVEDYIEDSKKNGMILEFAQGVHETVSSMNISDSDKKKLIDLLIQSSVLSVNMSANIIFNLLKRD